MKICIYDASNCDIADIMKKNSWQMGCRPCTNKQLLPLSERAEQVVAPPSAFCVVRWLLCPPTHFMPPLKKEAYCFATDGLSVGRSVDQVLSAHYLLTPSLDQNQTWHRGCPQSVDDSSWFQVTYSKVKVKPLFCPLNIFWPLHLINTKLGTGVALNE